MNTKQYLERLDVKRSRIGIHDCVRKDDLQPDTDTEPNQITLDKTMIQIDNERHWLYAAVDPVTNQFFHPHLFQTRKIQLTVLFQQELCEKQQIGRATFLVDAAAHLIAGLDRLALRF